MTFAIMSTRELIQEKLETELGEEIYIKFEPYKGDKQIKLDGTFTVQQLEQVIQV